MRGHSAGETLCRMDYVHSNISSGCWLQAGSEAKAAVLEAAMSKTSQVLSHHEAKNI